MWIASLTATVFAALALLHLCWAFGGQWGADAALPRVPASKKQAQGQSPAQAVEVQPMVRAFNPGPGATLVVAAALAGVTALVVAQAGLLGPAVRHPAVHWALYGVATAMLVRAVGDFRLVGFFKRISGTRFARLDTWLFSPLCVALGLGLFFVAAG